MLSEYKNIKVTQKQKPNKKGKIWGADFGGYPGLTHTAEQISYYIPPRKIFVEPFAGLGRISRKVKAEKYILNDLSDFAQKYLKMNFPSATITKKDYLETMEEYDSPNTFFFIDPPWFDNVYGKNPLTVCPRSVKTIYEELEMILPNMVGNWMVAGAVDGPLRRWGYHHKVITSTRKLIFGKHAKTYLVARDPFVNYHQKTILEAL